MEGRKIEASSFSSDLYPLLWVKNWTDSEAWLVLDNQSEEEEDEEEDEMEVCNESSSN